MRRDDQRYRMTFAGAGRRSTTGAVLVLPDCRPAEIRRAVRLVEATTRSASLVAVDGGLDACRAARVRADLWVGDGDSVRRAPRDIPVERYPRDKDHSDLSAALAAARRRGAGVVGVAGLLGGRLDHEWSNLFELGRHARALRGIVAPADRGWVLVTAHGCRVPLDRDETFSLFALSARAEVSLTGARWTLRQAMIRPGSRGLSNLARGGNVGLAVHRGVAALVLGPG